ncbi:hypothetical protein DFP72DRAFT_1167927 [Ephemerocybe angulata]|uniref:Uncharacterized protein n=1 Tax=Ephemerocybe angulata TaxID=980116 RepID=A0A8H6MBJ0_9AGAR|nr:hypothetical protein DFP72DRAFT_1167927 [Tulosesus angulatus]
MDMLKQDLLNVYHELQIIRRLSHHQRMTCRHPQPTATALTNFRLVTLLNTILHSNSLRPHDTTQHHHSRPFSRRPKIKFTVTGGRLNLVGIPFISGPEHRCSHSSACLPRFPERQISKFKTFGLRFPGMFLNGPSFVIRFPGRPKIEFKPETVASALQHSGYNSGRRCRHDECRSLSSYGSAARSTRFPERRKYQFQSAIIVPGDNRPQICSRQRVALPHEVQPSQAPDRHTHTRTPKETVGVTHQYVAFRQKHNFRIPPSPSLSFGDHHSTSGSEALCTDFIGSGAARCAASTSFRKDANAVGITQRILKSHYENGITHILSIQNCAGICVDFTPFSGPTKTRVSYGMLKHRAIKEPVVDGLV